LAAPVVEREGQQAKKRVVDEDIKKEESELAKFIEIVYPEK
jgi:hypothetical protein